MALPEERGEGSARAETRTESGGGETVMPVRAGWVSGETRVEVWE